MSLRNTLFLSVILLTGCDSGDSVDASFEAASTMEREFAIQIGFGMPATMAYFTVFGAEFDASAHGCPRTEPSSTGRSLVGGGCTTPDGTTYDGSVDLVNVQSGFGDEIDGDAPMAMTFNSFKVTEAGASGALSFDGTINQSAAQPSAAYTTQLHLQVSNGPQSIGTDASFQCDATGESPVCTPEAGAVGSLSGLGEFAIVGTYNIAAKTGTMELRGSDTLIVDLDASEGDCVPYTINGAATGSFCGVQ